jgi:aspartyl-tRNA(Asn)/glutamyl-tRNA(Gln) amidotransferase subunit A
MVSIADIQARIKNGESVRSIVEEALQKVEAAKEYNAIISVVRERALERAEKIDEMLKKGEDAGRLAGVPFIAKDNFLTLTGNTTAASNMLKPFEAPYQSTAIEKLEQQGAILIAKSNLDAFAHGGSTENSDFGPTKNPHDASRVPGGSSGGSAAAVALGIVPFALGTDTGGSIRQPASFTGVVGFKPTYGAVSRFGVVAMASSTDVVGPLASNAEDAANVFDIIAGRDTRDSTTIAGSHEWRDNFYPIDAPRPLKIGLIKEYMDDSVQPEVATAIREQVKKLEGLGHVVEEVSIPAVALALAVYYVVVPAEISSNLQRYDGIKFGYSEQGAKNLQELYGQSRDRGFNAENKRRILIGTYVLSSGYIDAYYRKAQTVRSKLINEFVGAFKNYTLLVGPVAPTTAFKLGENTEDPLRMYLADVMTVAASLAGLPAISVPAGKDSQGLPIGLQLIGEQRSDADLFSVAKQLEEANHG